MRFAIHPGSVISASDGQKHYISFDQLVECYGVPRGECVLWDDERPGTYVGRKEDYIHLYPLHGGGYVDFMAGLGARKR